MKFPIYLTTKQIEQLEFEVLSKDFYIFLTRKLLNWCDDTEYIDNILMRKNILINLSRTISGGKIYILNSDDMGIYEPAEYAWHNSQFLLIFRELSTIEFIEFICELINKEYFKLDFINEVLKNEGASFRIEKVGTKKLKVHVLPVGEIEEVDLSKEHVNIRKLVARMDTEYYNNDYACVLHSSACIFETMAKEIIGVQSIQDKTLKNYFNDYRKISKLPKVILDYILETYNKRNKTHTAGHGGLKIPNISQEEAIILIEMTKSFVRIEYRIQREK